MLVFRMLCRITQSLIEYRTESVSVTDHEQTMEVASIARLQSSAKHAVICRTVCE